jgi:ATP-dependent RNA helicase RhlE
MKFTELGLNESLLKAIKEQGYETPTPIQEKAIPLVIEGKDVLAAAQTGTGKTAGFTLPLLERLSQTQPQMRKKQIRVLVLTPTRELAAQVAESIKTYGKYMQYRSTVIFGGVGINPQMATLKKGVEIVIATPGRLLDIASQDGIDFSRLECLVLDEADRMLDMGFIHDIKKLMAMMPQKKQTLLFSATFSREIKSLASGLLKNPVLVEVARENSTATQISQVVYPVDKGRKRELLAQLIKAGDWQQVLVFTRTKHGANRLCKQLEEYSGIKSAAIHGNKSQGARTKALADFKARNIRVLVATDIAARGIDIDQLPHVVNYELPNVPEDYVHRIGRTGRAGMKGEAVSLVCIDEHELLRNIERFSKSKIEKIDIEAFRPDPSIEAEPIQNGGGRGRGQQRNAPKKTSDNSGNKRKRPSRKPATDTNTENKTPEHKKRKPKNPVAEKIGSRLQEKLDNLDKPKSSRNSSHNNKRNR